MFQYAWLQNYPWLVHSIKKNGGFCINCLLFGVRTDQDHGGLGILTSRPLTCFTKAQTVFKGHGRKYTHRAATVRAAGFLHVMEGNQPNVHQQIDNGLVECVTLNTKKVKCTAKVVILCGRQGIALRGHRDDMTDLESQPDSNHGNFWALIEFRRLEIKCWKNT